MERLRLLGSDAVSDGKRRLSPTSFVMRVEARLTWEMQERTADRTAWSLNKKNTQNAEYYLGERVQELGGT